MNYGPMSYGLTKPSIAVANLRQVATLSGPSEYRLPDLAEILRGYVPFDGFKMTWTDESDRQAAVWHVSPDMRAGSESITLFHDRFYNNIDDEPSHGHRACQFPLPAFRRQQPREADGRAAVLAVTGGQDISGETGSPEMLYPFVFTHFWTQNRYALLRPEMRENKDMERFSDSVKHRTALGIRAPARERVECRRQPGRQNKTGGRWPPASIPKQRKAYWLAVTLTLSVLARSAGLPMAAPMICGNGRDWPGLAEISRLFGASR